MLHLRFSAICQLAIWDIADLGDACGGLRQRALICGDRTTQR
ncbi:hypothetical protein [Tolypothrix sp. VBCCA 56010]